MRANPRSDHHSLPRDIGLHAAPTHLDPAVDPALGAFHRDDRVVARNDRDCAVVSLPRIETPSTEDDVPLFTDISTTEPQSIPEIESCLEAVAARLDPVGPVDCHYSVWSKGVQSASNTPQRFVEDLRDFPSVATEIEKRTGRTRRETDSSETVGSCLWQTRQGCFYLQASRRATTETFSVKHGLLRSGPPLDSTPITAFFEETAETPPNTQGFWPRRQLLLSGRFHPPLSRIEPIGEALQTDPEIPLRPRFAGENPLYGVSAESTEIPDAVPRELYRPLQHVSTLLYDSASSIGDLSNVGLKHIIVVQLPLRNTLFVTASVERLRS